MPFTRTVGGVALPCAAVLVVCVLLIVAYGHLLRATGFRDILATPLYSHPICPDLDGWSVTHLLFFGLLGLLYPGHHLAFFGAGVAWEVVETALGQNRFEVSGRRVQLIGEQDASGVSTGKDDSYWYGKSSDIIVNAGAYSLGSAYAELYWPNPPTASARAGNACRAPVAATAAAPALARGRGPAHVRAAPPSWV